MYIIDFHGRNGPCIKGKYRGNSGDDDRSTDAVPAGHEVQNYQMQLSTRSFSLKSLVTGIVAVGLVSIAIVIYSQWLVTRDFQQNTLFLPRSDFTIACFWMKILQDIKTKISVNLLTPIRCN